ncbi:hypothetical protein KC345_g11919, partial [Hortaea werneckii]
MLLTIVYRGDVQSLKNAYESKFEGMEEDDTRNLIKHTFMQNPELLTDTAFLDDISADMLKKNTSILIKSGNTTLYASDDLLTKHEVTGELPAFTKAGAHYEPFRKLVDNEWYQIAQFDLLSANKEPASIYL